MTLFCALFGIASAFAQTAPAFSQIVVFGDSLSDTGNVRNRTNSKSGGTADFPSHTFNYDNGRFDQRQRHRSLFQNLFRRLARAARATVSEYFACRLIAWGAEPTMPSAAATTNNGTHDENVTSTPFGDVTITIDDMGKQMDDYLGSHVVDPNALYIVWGGGNDLFNDDSAANVTATAGRATALMSRLAHAGAKYIMVPNVPPLGLIPEYAGDPAKQKSLSAAAAQYRDELSVDLTASLGSLASQGITLTLYPGRRLDKHDPGHDLSVEIRLRGYQPRLPG